MARILFIGDIVGKPGRKVLREVLPQWKEKYKPDVTIVNVENLAHGKGVTPKTLAEIDQLGIDCYTSGNHIFNRLDYATECFDKYPNFIRPANFEGSLPGHGYYRFAKENGNKGNKGGDGDQQYLIINLNATVFMEKQYDGAISNPFFALDRLLLDQAQKNDIIIVDFHSGATSEKVAMGLYADGRVAAILGTHTHVPTADARVLPKGTAYISDVGMTGPLSGVIGVKFNNVIKKFLEPETKFKNEVEEEGPMQINGALIETDENQKATKIEKLYQEI
jgi:metallophosphoesterase (TIGR00282 family)